MSTHEAVAPRDAVILRVSAKSVGTRGPRLRSDHVKVSQVGYLPGEPKVALLTAVAAQGPARVRRSWDDEVVLETAVGIAGADADSGDVVRPIDFSSLVEPGAYYLDVPGVGTSYDFRVGEDVFVRPCRLAMRFFAGQRCGCDVDLGPEFPAYHYRACHTAEAEFHVSSGRAGRLSCTGGWHDAGDYGRYVVNAGISLATLLWAWELYAANLRAIGADVLAEVRWGMRWLLAMQDADGGVWHKATSADFAGVCMPHEDDTPQLVIGSGQAPFKTTCATAYFAAVCAVAARVYRPVDAAYAERCLAAARRAWRWLADSPDHLFPRNPPGIKTGAYGDQDPAGARLWAAAELLRTTHDNAFDEYFLTHYDKWRPRAIDGAVPQGWADVHHFAMYGYALAPHGWVDARAAERIGADARAAADQIVARVERHPYRLPMRASDYVWGSNAVVANYALMLLIAHRLDPKRQYRTGALDALHYLLGRNTFNTSFVTHVGSRWPMHPHHRPSMADGIVQPWPGMLVGGPNADGKRDHPARQWFDDDASFKTNEVAINWNAPLVFLLAAALPQA